MEIKENIVFDNSVMMKIIMKEEGHEEACKILASARDIHVSLMVPQIFVFEFYNIATRLVGSIEAHKVMAYLSEIQFSVISLDEYGTMQASRIMEKCGNKISFYDAAYHALAFQMDANFVTADEKYFRLAKKLGRVELLRGV